MIGYLNQCKKKTIDIYDLAYQVDTRPIIDWSGEERKLFVEQLNELADMNILEIKRSKKGEIQLDFIHRTIKINKWNLVNTKDIDDDFLYRNDIGIDPSHYLKNPEEYHLEKRYIKRIVEFLDKKKRDLTLNEVSYIIFQDEKALSQPNKSSINGLKILSRLGLTIENLNYSDVIAPFYYEINGHGNKVLIVENKDTCYSLFRILYKSNTNVKGIIYGEGRAIVKKLDFIDVYNLDSETSFLYYGDIDQEGFDIFRAIIQKYPNYSIQLSKILYKELLKYESKPLKSKRNLRKIDLSTVGLQLPEEISKITTILEEEEYIPQEALNYEKMKVLFDGLQNRLY